MSKAELPAVGKRWEEHDVSCMLGHTIGDISEYGEGGLLFTLTAGEQFRMWHEQDCCEVVDLEDIAGELADLIGSPLTMAEMVTNAGHTEYGSETWTFYKFATAKGYVTLRWHGESNGYYSESVMFRRVA